MWLILVHILCDNLPKYGIWRENLPKFGRVISKSFLGTVLTTGFGPSILSKNYLMHLSVKSCG